jgi:Uncharacterized protein conserved in bacteria (DUF2188)
MAGGRVVYDVEPRPGGDWAVQRRGTSRATEVTESKSRAIADARRLAQHHALGQVVVRTEDGEIEREFTYGADLTRRPG